MPSARASSSASGSSHASSSSAAPRRRAPRAAYQASAEAAPAPAPEARAWAAEEEEEEEEETEHEQHSRAEAARLGAELCDEEEDDDECAYAGAGAPFSAARRVRPSSAASPARRGGRVLSLVSLCVSLLVLLPGAVLLFLVAAAGTLPGAQAQLPTGTGIGQQNNVTSLRGTWSSGAGHVVTGLQFFNPANMTFTYPTTAGQSYSFTDDGHWEQSLYIYLPKGDNPFCVTAQLIWQHGTYTINETNWIILEPFVGDGFQQIASRCGQTSQSVQPYNQVEYMSGFEIHIDTHYGESSYMLKMYEFDGTPKPLMWLKYDPPEMLPTRQLKEQVLNQATSTRSSTAGGAAATSANAGNGSGSGASRRAWPL